MAQGFDAVVLSPAVGSSLPRFSVVTPKGAAGRNPPTLVILSGDAVDSLTLVIVAPLVMAKHHGPLTRRLHVPVQFNGEDRVVVTEELVSIPKSALSRAIGTLDGYRDSLVSALDFLFQGY